MKWLLKLNTPFMIHTIASHLSNISEIGARKKTLSDIFTKPLVSHSRFTPPSSEIHIGPVWLWFYISARWRWRCDELTVHWSSARRRLSTHDKIYNSFAAIYIICLCVHWSSARRRPTESVNSGHRPLVKFPWFSLCIFRANLSTSQILEYRYPVRLFPTVPCTTPPPHIKRALADQELQPFPSRRPNVERERIYILCFLKISKTDKILNKWVILYMGARYEEWFETSYKLGDYLLGV